MAKKKIIYTVEREFLKKHEIRQSVELIIVKYIKSGWEETIPNRTVDNSSIKQ